MRLQAVLVSVLLAGAASPALAQERHVGLKAGANFSALEFEGEATAEYTDRKFGFIGGGYIACWTTHNRPIERQRLSHSLLLHGDDLETLVLVAHAIADRLLNVPESSARFPAEQHPDCHPLRPSGKTRQISAEATR